MSAFELPARAVDDLIDRALYEDHAFGDITSQSCIDMGTMARAAAVPRHGLVVCGGELFRRVFELVDGATLVDVAVPDGTWAEAGVEIWTVRGRARSLLSAERVALNFTQRMCGIATTARRYVEALAPGSRSRITDTRKTTPGLRFLERYAVRVGGAHNHRDNLGSAVMIKDNHIAAAGSISAAVERARKHAPHTSRIEVEVTTLAELDEACRVGAEIILFDNMDSGTLARAVERAKAEQGAGKSLVLEVSGGVTLERIAELSALGVDVISSGALTHSVKAADISLELTLEAHP